MAASPVRRPSVSAYLAFVVSLGAGALSCWYYFVGFYLDVATLPAGLALGALCATARFFPVSVGVGRSSFDAGSVPIFAALALGGPACALLVALCSAAHREPSRMAFMGATHALQILAGSLAFAFFSGEPLLVGTTGPGFSFAFVWGTLAAGLAFFSLDALVSPVLVHLKYGRPWGEIAREFILPGFPSDALAVFTTLAVGFVAASLGPVWAPVLLVGGVLSLAAFERARENRKKALRLEAENAALGESLRSSHVGLAARLIEGLSSRDGHAAAHAAASAVYAGDVAEELGLGEERSAQVRLTALLMDVGLLWVPDDVLLTHPGKLNSLGRMRLEEHPKSGEGVISAVPGLEEASRWARWHHEREDGTGYPDRLRGGWIPLEAKILAVVSLYASVALDDLHAPALHPDEARRRLVNEMGGTVDEGVAKAFLRVLDSEGPTYASASDGRFSFPSNHPDIPAVPTGGGKKFPAAIGPSF